MFNYKNKNVVREFEYRLGGKQSCLSYIWFSLMDACKLKDRHISDGLNLESAYRLIKSIY